MAHTNSRSGYQKKRSAEMNAAPGAKREHIRITKRDLLKHYSKETEAVKKNSGVTLIPSYRAVLARQGILVRNELGAGSYSKVKRAYCVGECTTVVAVKIVDKRIAATDFLQRFLPREVKFWPEIRHPNIIHVHKLFQDEYRVYMILEFAQGGDLLNYIQQRGSQPLDVNLVRKWGSQLCEAVKYLHDRDMAHRDLKLENLLLDASGNIKLTDFGFVKGDVSRSLSATFCGSRSYAAPEILQGLPYDPKKADVWAVTSIIYIIATGRMPFDETKSTTFLLRDQKHLNIHGFNRLSDLFSSLIRDGFKFDYSLRPKIGELSAHTWFSGTTHALPASTQSGSSVYEADSNKRARKSLSETTGRKEYATR